MFAHYKRLFFLVALVLILLSFFVPHSAVAGQTGNTRYDFELDIYNLCSAQPELIHFVGTLHMFSPGGGNGPQGQDYRFHINVNALGTGEFGNRYVYHSGQQYVLAERDNYDHVVINMTIRDTVISAGRGTNFMVRGVYHVVMNEHGEAVQFVHGWEAECRGN